MLPEQQQKREEIFSVYFFDCVLWLKLNCLCVYVVVCGFSYWNEDSIWSIYGLSNLSTSTFYNIIIYIKRWKVVTFAEAFLSLFYLVADCRCVFFFLIIFDIISSHLLNNGSSIRTIWKYFFWRGWMILLMCFIDKLKMTHQPPFMLESGFCNAFIHQM